MKPKSIGIVGGAGPLAGSYLLEKVLALANIKYGCSKDADFPKVILISYPFTDMLTENIDVLKLQEELRECLNLLRQGGASILAIACNTLHAFLEDKMNTDLIQIPRVLADLSFSNLPLILCTSTSARFGLHKRYFPCNYPDVKTQKEVDEIIDMILIGKNKSWVINAMRKLIELQEEKNIILGCTELSLFAPSLSFSNKTVIDPLEVIANKIIDESFGGI